MELAVALAINSALHPFMCMLTQDSVSDCKANLPAPASLQLYADNQFAVSEVTGKAGAAIIFTEACTVR